MPDFAFALVESSSYMSCHEMEYHVLRQMVPLLAAVFLCGCFQIQDELTLRPDGSGKVKLVLHTGLSEEFVLKLSQLRDGSSGAAIYPPANEEEARLLFPANDFGLRFDQQSTDIGTTLTIEATFKDVNRLLASPYAYAHQLVLKTNQQGALDLQAVSGGGPLAQAALLKAEGDLAPTELPGIEEAQLMKRQMHLEFHVNLPNPVRAANLPHDHQSVTWRIERAKCKDDVEFAARLAGMIEASCSMAGLRFSPVTPPRLGLLPFRQLSAGQVTLATAHPDTNRIMAAARFVPYAMRLTRVRDQGIANPEEHGDAELVGGFFLPSDMSPRRWGQVSLEAAVDAKGNNVLPKPGEERASRNNLESFLRAAEAESENEAEPATAEKPHLMTLLFKAPQHRTEEIAKTKARLDLHYMAQAEVIKLSRAVPAGLVADLNQPSLPNDRPDFEPQAIAAPRLADLGLALQLESAAIQSGVTTVQLQARGTNVILLDAQLFDADDQPWSTMFVQPEDATEKVRSWQLEVIGKPKPPFSLALMVARSGPPVAVPIILDHLRGVERKTDSPQPGPVPTETTSGFFAEPVSVTLSTVHYFPAGEAFFKKRPLEAPFGPWAVGTLVTANLVAPAKRVIQSVAVVRVTSARDDQGRPVSIVSNTRGAAGSLRGVNPLDSTGADPATGARIELRLGVPAPDAKTIQEIDAETTVLSCGGWKELVLTNIQTNDKIDLGEILPGTKLVIIKIGAGKSDRMVEATLDGPPSIKQLELRVELSGPDKGKSRAWERRSRRPRPSGNQTSRDLIIRNSEPRMSAQARTAPLTLSIRMPQDVKRERVSFKVKPLVLP